MVVVHVVDVGGASTSFECNDDDDILRLKAQIAASMGLPTSDIMLLTEEKAEVMKNDVPVVKNGDGGAVRLQMIMQQRTPAGKVECLHSFSQKNWDAAICQLLQELKESNVEQGQVIAIDLHNKGLETDCVASAHYSRDLPGRGTLTVAYKAHAGSHWDALYAEADAFARGKEVISISGVSTHKLSQSNKGDSKYLCVFYYEGETAPTTVVEHVRSAAGGWNKAANHLVAALIEADVKRGQVLSIDAHNDDPDADAVFTAFFAKDLPSLGPLALTFECSANENAPWKDVESRVARQSAGRDLVSISGSSNENRVVMYSFWHYPVEESELCPIEHVVVVEEESWSSAADALVSRLAELSVDPSQLTGIDAHNTGPGAPCFLSAYYHAAELKINSGSKLAWEVKEGSSQNGWDYLCGWSHAMAKGKDVVSITGASGKTAAEDNGLVILLFHRITGNVANPKAGDLELVHSSGGSWDGAANTLLNLLSQAQVQRQHIININACNKHPDASAEFQAHVDRSRTAGSDEASGRLAYLRLNLNAPGKTLLKLTESCCLGMGELVGKDVVSITGSSNCEGRSVLYVFYWVRT